MQYTCSYCGEETSSVSAITIGGIVIGGLCPHCVDMLQGMTIAAQEAMHSPTSRLEMNREKDHDDHVCNAAATYGGCSSIG